MTGTAGFRLPTDASDEALAEERPATACVAGERKVNGVVLMAYGTPRSPAGILPYYTDIRRGRPPSDEQLAELTARYEAIGGISPLAERTEAQRVAIAHQLDNEAPGQFVVEVGLRHVDPSIEAAVDSLADAGVDGVVGLVLAPHFSSMSIAVYLGRAAAAAESRQLPFAGVERWADDPAYVGYLAAAVTGSLAQAQLPAKTHVLFTAHALPQRIIETGDPYPGELARTAALVAARAGLPADRWSVAWQSAGRTPEPWLEPDVLAVIDALAASGTVDGVLVCPCGFVADHLEVLYDLDIEARQRAAAAGLIFARTPVVNDDRSVMTALARRVIDAASSC